jgi:hypothetical protein
LTWVQIVLLAVALATAFGLEAIFKTGMQVSIGGDISRTDLFLLVTFLQMAAFGILLFASQLIFLILMVRFRSRPPVANPANDPRNLLDDLVP